MISGITVRARIEPGDQIVAIAKDHEGKVIGCIVQASAGPVYLVQFRAACLPVETIGLLPSSLVKFRRLFPASEAGPAAGG